MFLTQLLCRTTLLANPEQCVFCNVSVERGFRVVWEDRSFIAFHDVSPSAVYHVLVVPKEHIRNVRDLRGSDIEMVQALKAIGHQVLDNFNVSSTSRRLGFHISPFNSVNHLHLHVLGLPFKSFVRRLKYIVAPPMWGGRHKGLSAFAEVDQVIATLKDNGRVRVSPC